MISTYSLFQPPMAEEFGLDTFPTTLVQSSTIMPSRVRYARMPSRLGGSAQ
jgi:hypothetical protein